MLLLVMNSIRGEKRKIRTVQREGECRKVLVTIPKVKMECQTKNNHAAFRAYENDCHGECWIQCNSCRL
jgi:hypothetical protein